MKSSLDIVIVNWNSGSLLLDCIESIKCSVNEDFILQNVVVVDNNSSDNSIEAIRDIELPLKIIENKENTGFAKACNQGGRKSGADYLLFLNPDTKLFHDSLSIPITFMNKKENENVGIIGIQLIDENGRVNRNCARFPSVFKMVYMSFGLDRLFPKIFKPHFISEWDHLSSRSVDQVMGSFFLIRGELFEMLGGYDERYFVYYEDLDLSYRAKEAGKSSYYLSEASIYHKGGGTSEKVKALRLFYILRSKLCFAKKHYLTLGYIIILLATFIPEALIRISVLVLGRKFRSCGEVISAYRMLIKSLCRACK